MTLQKFMIPPDSGSYTEVEPSDEVLFTALQGGVGRYRLDKVNASRTVTVQWTFDPPDYQYFRAFFATATQRGALPFLLDLLSEDGDGTVESTCNFVPGSVTLTSTEGQMYVQAATLEVKQIPRDPDADNLIILLNGGGDMIDALYTLVNVTAPATLYV